MDPSRLKEIQIFSGLSDDEAKRLAAYASEQSIAEGQILMKQGDYSTDLIMIEEGTADILQDGKKVATLVSEANAARRLASSSDRSEKIGISLSRLGSIPMVPRL